ncbi:hypothetical protein LZ31DRAFT_570703 [Colletotrichum somersetense]|nr:hypothetical protein LZ31DRAFT_570703 [Colletotrichum somersetense]
MYDGQEELDNLVWDKNDEESGEAQNQMRLRSTCRKIRLEGASPDADVMIRLPCPSLVQFPDEKTIYEASAAALIGRQTQLPIPQQLFYGQGSIVGPFVIMQRIQNWAIWGQVERCLLQLSQMTFPRIGSLVEADGLYEVAGRPITHNMTDMIQLANISRSLIFQHNDLVTSEADCRNKYMARQIFQSLDRQGRLSIFGFAEDNWSAQSRKTQALMVSPAPSGSDILRLWGDDFRAGNILLTETDEIGALIDWEYTYVGPTQFILDPLWWLLIVTAEMSASGIDDWRETYEMRLKTWLSAIRKQKQTLPGPLWSQESWAFDTMYWRFLDERFFGD